MPSTPKLDTILGLLYGQAYGDALGLPAEHKTRAWCQEKYADGGPFTFERVERPSRGEVFEAGEWSDDTDQALILADSYIACKGFDEKDIARRLVEWSKTQKGMGTHTRRVLAHPAFLTDPYGAAMAIHKEYPDSAPNGAVMRGAIVGLIDPVLAADYARITHAHRECIRSATELAAMVDIAPEWRGMGSRLIPACDDGERQGYTSIPVSYALWALSAVATICPNPKHVSPELIRSVLAAIIRQGGDTDTNAAVAGAVLGAYTGAGVFGPLLGDMPFERFCRLDRTGRALHEVLRARSD